MLKHKLDGGFLKKRCGEDLQNCVERVMESEAFFENGNQNVNGNRDPDLGFDAVGRGTKEAVDSEVLFDPFEKEFDLPASSIEGSDSERRQEEIVG